MGWKFESGVSLSVQIVNRLRADILRGDYTQGEPFPTVRQLAYEAGVNPNTMQKALSLLEDEGLIIAKSTAGRVVTSNNEAIMAARQKAHEGFAKDIISEAKRLSFDKIELIKYIEEGWING